ncbi:MAG: hypothetical protein ACLPPF_22380 [Rhodomicrobium sp.]
MSTPMPAKIKVAVASAFISTGNSAKGLSLAAFLVSDGAAAHTGNVEYIDAGYHIVG